jgi:hypothetical protein
MWLVTIAFLSLPRVSVDPQPSFVTQAAFLWQFDIVTLPVEALIIPLVLLDLRIKADSKETRQSSSASIRVWVFFS